MQERSQRRVELRPRTTRRQRRRRLHAANPVRHLDELRQLRQPRRNRNQLTREKTGPTTTVPLLIRGRNRVLHRPRQPQLRGQCPRQRRVLLDHPLELAVTRKDELQADAEPMQRRIPRADQPERRSGRAQASKLVVVLSRLERDVVAEPLRLFVRVGVTADVHEQSGVVDDRALLVVEPDPLRQPQRDQTLTQHMLHRLPKPEVDTERKRSHKLGQPHRPGLPQLTLPHARTLRPHPPSGKTTHGQAAERQRPGSGKKRRVELQGREVGLEPFGESAMS